MIFVVEEIIYTKVNWPNSQPFRKRANISFLSLSFLILGESFALFSPSIRGKATSLTLTLVNKG